MTLNRRLSPFILRIAEVWGKCDVGRFVVFGVEIGSRV